jgi:hypothetical protein
MDGSQLKGVSGAFMVICNDYEFELIRQKTGMGEADTSSRRPAVITKGEGLLDPYEGWRRRCAGGHPIASKIRRVSAMRSAAVS